MEKFNRDIKRPILYTLIGLIIVFLDQFTKWLVLNKSRGGFFNFGEARIKVLTEGEVFIIPKLLKIEIYRNKGIAFGFSISYFILYVLVILVLVFCLLELRKGIIKKNFLVVLALVLVVCGAISNLVDRIRLGYVVDILHFIPTGSMFNLADIAIVVGIGMLVWREIRKSKFIIHNSKACLQK